MSYQVLARKWRPRIFREMVGQEHVLKALINALDHNRLHHAYLFTGTRGVGKTTIARILAKCLNCETGVSSEPCGECSACNEIAEGRFVDLIEVDAASRTKVEDTRELLDNVQYAPSRGRYKIYLIDEVHMLSNHSFNALLKTLEEPPDHVKFLLATTDPQKLPVTILSRCLQFNLKNMSSERIVGHLQHVLTKEAIPFEESALWPLSRSADGSMRDALSLTDQAIAFGGGKVLESEVGTMLGTIDHVLIEEIMQALVAADGPAVLAAVAKFAEHAPDYDAALADLLTLLHRIAIAQALPEALDNSYGDQVQILKFASALTPEDVQMFYQTTLIGRRDLSLASDPRMGVEMTLLRMLVFKPQGLVDVPTRSLSQNQESPVAEAAVPIKKSIAEPGKPVLDSTASGGRAALSALVGAEEQKQEPRQGQVATEQSRQSQPKESNVSSLGQAVTKVLKNENASGPSDQGRSSPAEPSEIRLGVGSGYSESQPEPQRGARESIVAERKEQSRVEAPSPVAQIASKPQHSPSPQLKPATESNVARLQELVASVVPSAAPVSATNQSSPDTPKPAELPKQKMSLDSFAPNNWISVYKQIEIKGIVQSTVANCVMVGREDNHIQFILDQDKTSLYDPSHAQRIADYLSDYFAHPVRVDIQLSSIPEGMETPAEHNDRVRKENHAHALATLRDDPVVQTFEREFGAKLQENTVKYPS